MLCLEREDIGTEGGTVRIVKTIDERDEGFFLNPPKSKTGIRTVSLPEFALAAARRHLDGRIAGPLLTTRTGNYVTRSNFVRRDWKPLLEKAEVPYRKFHTLRHTQASRLLAAGVDPAEVVKRIGDRIEILIRVYAHWIPTDNRDTAAKVNTIYGGSGNESAPLPARRVIPIRVQAGG